MKSEKNIVIDYVLPDSTHSEGNKKAPLSSYTLALLLAQTPKELLGCDVVARVHDEQAVGPYDPAKSRPDILCLTYLTTGANRAYEISDVALRSTSMDGEPIKVVHGGVHATCLPREALLHSNIAVRGEVTQDFQREVLSQALRMEPGDREALCLLHTPKVITRPPADWSWMDRKHYIVSPTVQTSVGCPFNCDFCSVTEVFGAGMRAVDEESLRRELATLPRKALLAVIDDNFLQGTQPKHIEHALMVGRVMKELGFRWFTEVTVRTLIDARKQLKAERGGFDLIEFFAQHGCIGFFFGIETMAEGGAGLVKSRSAQDTAQLIRDCQSNGMGALGAFVLGVGDDETPDHAKRLLEFAIEDARLDFAQFSINTPMPGAKNFLTGIRDGRIFNFDWDLYDAEHCVMHHPRMSPEQLEEAHSWLYKEFYSHRSTFKRFDLWSMLTLNTKLWRRAAIGIPVNMYLHRTEKSWNNRLDASVPRPIVPEPHPTVMEHVREALGANPMSPSDLFNVRRPDKPALETVEG